MSPSTFDLSDITLVPPAGAHKGLIAVLHAVEKALRQSIGLLASGKPAEQPDLLHQMEKRGLLHDGLDDKHDFAVMVDAHAKTVEKLRAAQRAISHRDEDVSRASYSTFDTSNGTFTACMTKVRQLQSRLESASKWNTTHRPLPRSEEQDLIATALHAVSYVHSKVDSAARQIQHQKHVIEKSAPTYPALAYPSGRGGGGGVAPSSVPDPTMGRGTTDPIHPIPLASGGAPGVVATALSQVGVHEIPGMPNHLPRNGNKPKPYDIGDQWCAAFATWTWKHEGIPLDWTSTPTKGLAVRVPTIWADAQRHGLADKPSDARAGDLIVLHDQSHMGVVKKVDADGTIHTIEGNSGDAVTQHKYSPGDGQVTGVIHPPAQNKAT
ncbi:CHAP domain-containing protein [Nocardia africana]|uniref:CHAP domain-containing protein n=1 Tax=Nocardia africana TaxID=134964 RepID=A0ABW6NF75_9NOCA